MEQIVEFAGYSASEATKILAQATSDLVDFGKESLWAYYDSSENISKDIEKNLSSNVCLYWELRLILTLII